MTHPDTLFITLADLKRLFLRSRHKLKVWAFLAGGITLLLLLRQEPRYCAKATFRQSSRKSDQQLGFKGFLKSVGVQDLESAAASVMQSKIFLRGVVEDLGLQMSMSQKSRFSRFLTKIGNNLSAECGRTLKDADPFLFRQVIYKGDSPLQFTVRFLSKSDYELMDEHHQVLTTGTVGKVLRLQDVQFILEKTPADLVLGLPCHLTIHTCEKAVEELLHSLEINPSPADSHLLVLTFAHPDRHLTALMINQIMENYQAYLRNENDEIARVQLGYLEQRQNELMEDVNRALSEQSLYLKNNLQKNGLAGLFQEMDGEGFAIPKEKEYISKLYDIDLELKRLERAKTPQKKLEYAEALLKKPQDQLQSTNLQMEEVQTLLTHVEKGDQPPLELLERYQKKEIAEDGEPLKLYLKHLLHHLFLRQQELQENFQIRSSLSCDFQGVHPDTAEQLYLGYQNQLHEIQVTVRQLLFVSDQIEQPDFELSSLCSILSDAVTQTMVDKASQLALQLRDESNHSGKEQARVKEALSTQKCFISHHIDQMIELHKLRAKLTEDKITALQEATMDLMKKEKELIEDKLLELRHQFSDLPELCRLENEIKFKKKLSMSVLEGMTELTESKIVNHRLHQVESKPVDRAVVPQKPKRPHLLLFSLLGGMLGVAVGFTLDLGKGLFRGLPVSAESLKAYGHSVCGSLSSGVANSLRDLNDQDLETLRRVALFTQSSKCTALIGGPYLDYSHQLAELFSMQKQRVLLIQCAFDAVVSVRDVPGLWHCLAEGLSPCPVRHLSTYDYLPTGGTTRHGAELLSCPDFADLLETLKPQYDRILLFSSASDSAEALALLRHAGFAVVTANEETFEALHPYVAWSETQTQNHLTFITTS
jgi:tyrosine-protein kinase Etk/Wzc